MYEETKSHRALVVKNKNIIFVTSNRRNDWIQERYFCDVRILNSPKLY